MVFICMALIACLQFAWQMHDQKLHTKWFVRTSRPPTRAALSHMAEITGQETAQANSLYRH